MKIIAEVKTISPFGYQSKNSWEELFEIANRIGDIISIHTNTRWGGSLDLIKKARKLTNKPILAKGIHNTDGQVEELIDIGIDHVLIVGRIPKSIYHCLNCFIEPLDLNELRRIPLEYKVVWNSRDLADGNVKKETFEEARKIFPGWLCQASNIRTKADIKLGADAILVGENLVEFSNVS